MEELIASIKDKKELRGLSDGFVAKQLRRYLEQHPNTLEKYRSSPHKFLKSKEYKQMQKEIRALLREVYGSFIMSSHEKMRAALEGVRKEPSMESHEALLKLHRSSRERLPFYTEVYKSIFELTGKPKRVLDLACGLNPFSYPWLGCKPEYISSDISPEMCALINEYFDFSGIKGGAFVFDLLDFKETGFSSFISADVCFLLKTLDSIETLKRDFSEKLILGLPANRLVVSFATQSLGGGKVIRDERRAWFEKILKRNALEHDFFKLENEIFYVVKR